MPKGSVWRVWIAQFAHTVFFAGAVVLVLGLPVFPVLITVGNGMIGGAALVHALATGWHFRRSWAVWAWAGLLVFLLSNYAACGDMGYWWTRFRIEILLFAMPLCFMGGPRMRPREHFWILLAFLLSVSVISFATLGRYFQNQEYLDSMLYRGQAIPFVGHRSHIYVSVMLTFAIWVALWLGLQVRRLWHLSNPWANLRWLFYALALGNVFCLHVVGARTAVLAFYVSAIAVGLQMAWQPAMRKRAILAGLAVAIIIVVMFTQVEALQRKVHNARYDIEYYRHGDNLNNQSASRRVVSWVAAWHQSLKHPAFGVGLCNMGDALREQVALDKLPISRESVLGEPHNEYLLRLLAYGVMGLVTFLVVLVLPWFVPAFRQSRLLIAFWALCLTAFCFESFLQRQLGANFVLFFWCLLLTYPSPYEAAPPPALLRAFR